MPESKGTVAVLGASDKPDRYSNRAVRLLLEHGYTVLPVHPSLKTVEGLEVLADLGEIRQPVDTLTVYVSPAIGAELLPAMRSLEPRRIIFNPGSEVPALVPALRRGGIEVVENCTLVMLNLGLF